MMKTTARASASGGALVSHGSEMWVLTWSEAMALYAALSAVLSAQAAKQRAAREAAYGDGGYALSMGEWAEAGAS